ncbi:succinylglutamate desuccinylase/aspartoacylase family protein [Candidatus Woesearchaeota archaeon]|nr:succinylglutamate desuccinylase/aspartoacylase family protein [Candidatus Woesearchaeota archaeon]
MKLKNSLKKINVGNLGSFNVEIPVIKLGYGNPKITILTGLHGDEYSGLLILKELLNKIEVKKGTLQLIVCANPLARVTKTRETFTDFMDLNRAFPGDEKGSMTQKIAHKLLQILGDSNLVIDLHTMFLRTKPTPIFVSCRTSVDEKSIEALKAFGHENVWKVEAISETQYGQSLGAFLARQMIPHFALETDNINYITDEDLNSVVEGLKSVLAKNEMINSEIKNVEIKTFVRNRFYVSNSGIFIPHVKVNDEVNENDLIGYIISQEDFEMEEVRSSKSGFVSDINPKSFVLDGEHVYSIGVWNK